MAVDEVLLESAARDGRSSLRFYQWSEPTLSLGYFQSHRQRDLHRGSRDCPLVRRQTGGGAILHDAELTYSLALSVAQRRAADAARLYHVAHTALVDVLATFGVEARLFDGPAVVTTQEPFLCFERRAPGDVLIGRSKICGSAQRRRGQAILQHGSLLLARSPHASDLSGLAELTLRPWDLAELRKLWRRELATRLGLSLVAQGLSAAELDQVRTLAIEKYGTSQWTARR